MFITYLYFFAVAASNLMRSFSDNAHLVSTVTISNWFRGPHTLHSMGLHNSESSKSQTDQHKFAAGRKIYFILF